LDGLKIAHPGVKTSVGRGKPAIIPAFIKILNAFNRLPLHLAWRPAKHCFGKHATSACICANAV